MTEKGDPLRDQESVSGIGSTDRTAERVGFSLATPEGAEAVANLARLATGEVTLERLDDDRYGIEGDGTLRLAVDEETFAHFSQGHSRNRSGQ